MTSNASLHVMQVLQAATEPLSTAEVMARLGGLYDEDTVISAIEHWKASGEVVRDAGGRWGWIGPGD